MLRVERWQDIQLGDFWSYKGEHGISLAIRKIAGDWSHSGIVADSDWDGRRLLNVEALDVIRRRPLSLYKDDWDDGRMAVFHSETAWTHKEPALQALLKRVGEKYDWLGTASLALVVPVNKALEKLGVNRVLPSPIRSTSTPKCSELVLLTLQAFAFNAEAAHDTHDLSWVFAVPDLENFTPADLVRGASATKKKT